MAVDYTPTLDSYTGQGYFRFWCQKVLPLVYDDSLSFYELLNKVVVYLNNVIEDMKTAGGNIDQLLEAYTELQNYVNNWFSGGEYVDAMKEEIKKFIEEHPEYVTTVMPDSIAPDKLTPKFREFLMQAPSKRVELERLGRLLDRFTYAGREEVLRGQSCGFDGTFYYTAGNFIGQQRQSVCKFNQVGEIINYNNQHTLLGHCNGMAIYNDYLLLADSDNQYLCLVNKNDLSFVRRYSTRDLGFACRGVSVYNDVVYCIGMNADNPNMDDIYTVDGVGSSAITINRILTINRPDNTVAQGFVVYDGYAYTLWNRATAIYKIDLTTGEYLYCYNIPDSDGYFPLGEVETLFIMNNDIYLWTVPYYNVSMLYRNADVNIGQIFKTDILNVLQNTSYYSYMLQTTVISATVDGNATQVFNPTQTFTTIEEACLILNNFERGVLIVRNVTEGVAAFFGGVYSVIGLTGDRNLTSLYLSDSIINVSAIANMSLLYCRRSTLFANRISAVKIHNERSDLTLKSFNFANTEEIDHARASFDIYNPVGFSAPTITPSDALDNVIKYNGNYNANIFRILKISGGQLLATFYTGIGSYSCQLTVTDLSSGNFEKPIYNNSYISRIKMVNYEVSILPANSETWTALTASARMIIE